MNEFSGNYRRRDLCGCSPTEKLSQRQSDHRRREKTGRMAGRYPGSQAQAAQKDVDAENKIITAYEATAARIHDSQVFSGFITDEDTNVYADSARAHFATQLPEGVTAHICEKGWRGNPLTKA